MKLSHFLLSFSLVCLAGCQPSKNPGLLGEYRFGERIQVGPMIYNVYDAEYSVTIGEGADARIPKNRFLLLHLSAVNGGSAKSDVSVPTLTLVDDNGQTYLESDNGDKVPQWLGVSRKVRPAESLSGTVVFDVEPKHYKLRIADDTDEHYALVDIPLSFGDAVSPIDSGTVPPPTPK